MGSPVSEPGHRDTENQVSVTLTHGFWMGKYEVTQGEWARLYGEVPGPLLGGRGDNFPVYFVSWLQAKAFCLRLMALAQQAGSLPAPWRFDLPTEAQWEYACRAGTTTAFAFGSSLTKSDAVIGRPFHGRADGTPGAVAEPVGSFPANAWGLHDMHGNEFEWARDWFHPRLPGGIDPDLSDLKGPPNRDGTYSRARRGGAWMDAPEFARSAIRLPYEPDRNADHIGFRLAIVAA
ncbi:MAG: formylglycine-generating enzyme family protein [Alphaproteobacteria bacterium]|nr:formylglycine-generating enzyme family protein [Alphaproteobacteria bacterium]